MQQVKNGDGFDVGDVLSESWGYDQTNVDFYRVVRRSAKGTVWVRPMGQAMVEGSGYSHGMACMVKPGRDAGNHSVKTTRLSKGDKLAGTGRVVQDVTPVGGWDQPGVSFWDGAVAGAVEWTVSFKDGSSEQARGDRTWVVEAPVYRRRLSYYGEGEDRHAYMSVNGHGSASPWTRDEGGTYCSWYA